MTEDIKLLKASKNGDAAAFEKIVIKYQSLVCAITFSGTGHLDLSEELAQETFLEAWKNLGQLKDLSKFRAWLCTIARNMLKNYYRRKKPNYVDASHLDLHPKQAPSPSESLNTKEELAMLQQALMQIPADYREPLVLYYRQEKSTRQVAVTLGLTESAVRTRLHRARQMLREEIAARLEYTLEKTAPGKDFTKAVMVAIGGAAIGLTASTKAAGTVETSAATSSNAITAVMSTVTAKVITAAAIIVVITGAAIFYTRTGPDAPMPVQPAENSTLARPASTAAPIPENQKSSEREVPEGVSETVDDSQQANITRPTGINGQENKVSVENETKTIAPIAAITENSDYVFEPNGVLSGLITDIETGEPVTDAEITLSPGRLYRAKTDENGFYHFDVIDKDGDYSIGVYSNEYIGLAESSEQPRLHLKKASQAVKHFQLPKACMVNVYVMDEAQNPIKDVRIWTTSSADEYGIEVGQSYVSRRTDENGYIQLGGFKPSNAQYVIHAVHIRYGEWVTQNGRRYREPFYDYSPGYAKIRLTDPDVIEYAEIILRKGESVQGIAKYTDGTPAAECKIVPYPDWWHSTSSPPSFKVDPNGLFTLSQIIPGTYRIQANVPTGEYSSIGFGLFTVQLPREKEKLLTLSIPQKPTNDDSRNAAVEYKLYGIVTDAATGNPIPKFQLRYKRLAAGYYSTEGKWTQYENDNGSFSMDVTGSEPSVCQVQAVAEGYAPQWSQPIDTANNQAVLIKLTPGGSITGVVVDAKGDPVADAHVIAYSLAGKITAGNEQVFESEEGAVTTNKAGQFMLQNLAPGNETLKITHPDYADTLVSNVAVQEGKQNNIGEVVLNKGGTIEGFVYDNLGNPQAGAAVYAQNHYGYSTSMIQYAKVVTDPNGYYQIQNLPDTLCYIVRPRAYEQSGVVSRAVIPTDNQTIRLDLGDGTVVTGRLVIDDKPLAKTRVSLTLGQSVSTGLYRCHAETDDNGRFILSAAQPGLYTLSYDRRTKLSTSTTTKMLDFQIDSQDQEVELGVLPSQDISLQVWIQDENKLLETSSYFYIRQNDPHEGPCVFWKDEPKAAEMPYTIGLPAPGSYYAVVRYAGGFCEYRYPVQIESHQTLVEISIPVTAGGIALTGTLPEQINHVWFTNDDRSISGLLYNNHETGQFRIENFAPGKYYFCPKWPYKEGSIVRTIPNMPEFNLKFDVAELQDKLTERLTVYVLDVDGLPVKDAVVWIRTNGQKQIPVYGDDYSSVFYLPAGKHTIYTEKNSRQAAKTYRLSIDPYNTASGESYETFIQLEEDAD